MGGLGLLLADKARDEEALSAVPRLIRPQTHAGTYQESKGLGFRG
jgi:hypothetical protein